jgi:hypothetical protein
MTRNAAIIAITLLLTACANSAGEYKDSVIKQTQKIAEARESASPALKQCARGRKPSEIPRQEFVKYMVCFNNVDEAKILPVMNYPELYIKVLATRIENASLYSQGKINYEQFKSRSILSISEYEDDVIKHIKQSYDAYAAQDEQENAEIAAGLASFKQPPTTRTSCFSTGMATNCTSRTSNY